MSENCTQSCSGCTESCSSGEPRSLQKAPHEDSYIGKVIAVVSGKGGVGKSLVTGLLAAEMQRRGHRAAILDADVTGPSIPQMFGVHENARGGEDYILPVRSETGVQMMSMNFLLPNETDPVVWRGAMIAGAVEQMWTEVIWDDVDYMFVDMPPGTGDVSLTVFQTIPVSGIVFVTSPQQLVGMIVEKAMNMAEMMAMRVLGIVENMAYFNCPDCGSKHSILGKGNIEETAKKFGIEHIAKLPIESDFAIACDEGRIEDIRAEGLTELADFIERGTY